MWNCHLKSWHKFSFWFFIFFFMINMMIIFLQILKNIYKCEWKGEIRNYMMINGCMKSEGFFLLIVLIANYIAENKVIRRIRNRNSVKLNSWNFDQNTPYGTHNNNEIDWNELCSYHAKNIHNWWHSFVQLSNVIIILLLYTKQIIQ